MIPIKFNADYEIVLFQNIPAPKIINYSLEFLALYLENRGLHSDKKYNSDFLDHVETVSGSKPQIVFSDNYENWWGKLEDINLEKKINSKEFVTRFDVQTKIISSLEDLHISEDQLYLAKNPYGMSGKNFVVFKKGEEHKLNSGKWIIEPLYDRKDDFSHYIFSDGSMICYENIIDHQFQYRGTLFSHLLHPSIESLRFYKDFHQDNWNQHLKKVTNIMDTIFSLGGRGDFSIDCFSYFLNGEKKIRSISEINYRKTMGLMTWLLSKKYAVNNQWSLLIFGKKIKKQNSFAYIQKKISSIAWDQKFQEGCLQLSPGDTRFEMFFLTSREKEEGAKLFKKLTQLLPECQFPVEI